MKGRNDDTTVGRRSGRDGAGEGERRVAHRTRHEWDAPERLSTTLVRAVSAVSGSPPTEVTPLHESVDVDALDALFAPTAGGPRPSHNSLRLVVEGYDVDVFGDGRIVIRAARSGDVSAGEDD